MEHQRQELFKFLVLGWDFFVTAGRASGLLATRIRLARRLDCGVNLAFKQACAEKLFVNTGLRVCLHVCVQTSNFLGIIVFTRLDGGHKGIIILLSVAA